MSVYIDTSAFYAIVDDTDANHQAAVSTWQNLLRQGEELLTSSNVLTEIIALLHHRFGTDVVRRFVSDNLPAVQVYWSDQTVHATALNAMLMTPGKNGPSLTDCANVVVMQKLTIRRIFAYDRHFSNMGLDVLG